MLFFIIKLFNTHYHACSGCSTHSCSLLRRPAADSHDADVGLYTETLTDARSNRLKLFIAPISARFPLVSVRVESSSTLEHSRRFGRSHQPRFFVLLQSSFPYSYLPYFGNHRRSKHDHPLPSRYPPPFLPLASSPSSRQSSWDSWSTSE